MAVDRGGARRRRRSRSDTPRPAAELAAAAGLTEFALSLTHEDAYAAAVVVGT